MLLLQFAKPASDDDADEEGGGRETKDELEPKVELDHDEDLPRPPAPAPQVDVAAPPAGSMPGESPVAAGSLGNTMIFRPGGSPIDAQAQAREPESTTKLAPSTQAKTAGQRASQTARELGEALEPESRIERSAGGPNGPEVPGLGLADGPDDGMEM